MSVYVDDARLQFGPRWRWSHMTADSLDELHGMARRLRLRETYLQDGRFVHYDITEAKRALALAYGAMEVTSRELVPIARRLAQSYPTNEGAGR